MNKIIFMNIDTQRDFMLKTGKLYVPEAEEIIPNLKKLTDYAIKNDIQTISSQDYHDKNSKEISQTPNFINTFPAHCIYNTNGWFFISETYYFDNEIFKNYYKYPFLKQKRTKISSKNIIIRKNTFDVFSNPNTENILNIINPEYIYVYGVATDFCVKFAIEGLLKRNYNVILIEDAVKEINPIDKLFQKWKKLGVKFIKTKEVIEKFNFKDYIF